jgi:hypothetical protein
LFGDCPVARGIYEVGELGVCDLGGVHIETIDVDAVDGPGVGHWVVTAIFYPRGIARAHAEFPTGDQDHVRGRQGRGQGGIGPCRFESATSPFGRSMALLILCGLTDLNAGDGGVHFFSLGVDGRVVAVDAAKGGSQGKRDKEQSSGRAHAVFLK